MRVIVSPMGSGKTTIMGTFVGREGVSTCWLVNTHDDAAAVKEIIEKAGGDVATPKPLRGKTNGKPNCLHPDTIEMWQAKGYNYRQAFCQLKSCCERKADPCECPYLEAIDLCKVATVMVTPKALGRRPDFFSHMGNENREWVVIDEDPIGLLRPLVRMARDDLSSFVTTLERITGQLRESCPEAAVEAEFIRKVFDFVWEAVQCQPPGDDESPEAVDVPKEFWGRRKDKCAREVLMDEFHKLMRRDPRGTVRNVLRDLYYLVEHAAGKGMYAVAREAFFHLKITVPKDKRTVVLDATGNPELLRPIFRPKPILVVGAEPVIPVGRIVQFADFNGPRSYLNNTPNKLVRIIDAIGDRHPNGTIVLISHKSCVEKLRDASRHKGRIKTAYFGKLRGRNDLEPSKKNNIVCHIVAGSPKTTECDSRQLALAVYGRKILPFPPLENIRVPLRRRLPIELAEEDRAAGQLWEVRLRGYSEPRMGSVYEHTVVAELTQAADRARVLIHPAIVYLVTNEPCPKLWFAEMCYAGDLLDLAAPDGRADFAANYAAYAARAGELLDKGERIGNADVCRAMGKKPCAGLRYWQRFLEQYGDALEGVRKYRWKHGRADSKEEPPPGDGPQGPPDQRGLPEMEGGDGPYGK